MALEDHKPCYEGAFTVETWNDAGTEFVPKSEVTIKENEIIVGNGSVQQVMGGIQLYANGKPFSWGYKYVRKITAGNGEVLWQNRYDKDK